MNDITNRMFESGVFKQKYIGIIEIFPHKVMNSELLNAALEELAKTHDIYKLYDSWLRAFRKGVR